MSSNIQPPLPPGYQVASESEISARLAERKRGLAGRLLILCHHYQHDSVFALADLTGDSLKLAREAAENDSEYLVFLGVHFMAESADLLAAPGQRVLLPHLDAGCPMADMASRPAVEAAWTELVRVTGLKNRRITPITYVNSSAAVKALVGARGGAVCTSSNAERVLAWALEQGDKVFFFPDEHLGRNSAAALGIDEKEIVVWRRGEPLGGNSETALRRARVLLWDGYCEVHMRYFPEHVRAWRRRDSEARIVIHPESRREVLRECDLYGSTETIIKAVADSPAGSHWVIGTEYNLVNRLARQHPDKVVQHLGEACLCPTMAAIRPAHLLWLLDELAAGRVVNQVRVDPAVAAEARLALDRMLAI